MDLGARWTAFAASIGVGGDAAVAAFADLERRHGDPGRHYHTLAHVADCLAELDAAPGLCDRPDAVELALWFHDAVYDPRAADNEARSTALLRGTASRLGLDPALARRAEALVMATAHLADSGGTLPAAAPPGAPSPGTAPSRRDREAIHDIDLAILGAPRDRFDAYETAVRREYAFLRGGEWRSGRSRVLRTFLAMPRIYLTDPFRDRLEARARRNLADGLARLA
jgi:predicted metal-dependent HD superfamily phosphohydrolase